MKVHIPEYYDHFHCIASACPDSCCKEWEVDVDSTAAAFYRSLQGDLGERLRRVLKDTESGTIMEIRDGRCPMWRRDGLCQIQVECGHEALCQVCRDFPRLRYDYGDFVEYGLELSCPEAARLILSDAHTFRVEETPGGERAEYDPDTMEILLASRQRVMDFLNTTRLQPNWALAAVLLYSHEVQSWIDGGDPALLDAEACLALARQHAAECDWALLTRFFQELEILTPCWKQRLFAPAACGSWHVGFLKLAQYFIERYWLQAVSDFDLICRVKLLVAACLLIYCLGGDFLQTAQLFSKEIENDPDNLEAVLDGAYTAPALTDVHLLSLLLND